MAYRDDAAEVLEAPTAEGLLRIELGPRATKLTVAHRTLHIVGRVATLVEHKKQKQDRRQSFSIAGRLVIARDVPHEDLGVWVELEPGGSRTGMRRIFGVAPVSLLEPEGLAALALLDRAAQQLRAVLAELAGDVVRGFEIGRGLDKVLVADHGDRFAVYARRLFRDRARIAAEVYNDGRVVIVDGKQRREVTVRSRFGVTVVGDYVRFADPEGSDLARFSIPWIGPEDRRELARRIGQIVDPAA